MIARQVAIDITNLIYQVDDQQWTVFKLLFALVKHYQFITEKFVNFSNQVIIYFDLKFYYDLI